MSNELDTFAAVDLDHSVIAITRQPHDDAARAWFARLPAAAATLVVLDLAADEAVEVGDRVTVDGNGVATLDGDR